MKRKINFLITGILLTQLLIAKTPPSPLIVVCATFGSTTNCCASSTACPVLASICEGGQISFLLDATDIAYYNAVAAGGDSYCIEWLFTGTAASCPNVPCADVNIPVVCSFPVAGTYTVQAKAYINGNYSVGGDVLTFIVWPNPVPVISPANPTLPCAGGSVTLNAGSGYSAYQWSTGATTQTINVSTTGPFTVTVTDANGCSGSAQVNVTQPVNNLVITISTTQNNCAGACNGTATAAVSGGTPPYNYQWSNAQTTATATGLCAGNYTVTVTDANGCTAQAIATVGSCLSCQGVYNPTPLNPVTDQTCYWSTGGNSPGSAGPLNFIGTANGNNNRLIFKTAGTERMTILGAANAGFVGIGTNNPATLLQMHNATIGTSNSNMYLKMTNSRTSTNSTDGYVMGLTYDATLPGATAQDRFWFNFLDDGPMDFFTNALKRVTILGGNSLSGGFVGINTVNPGNRLEINSAINNNSGLRLPNINNANGSPIPNPYLDKRILTVDPMTGDVILVFDENTGGSSNVQLDAGCNPLQNYVTKFMANGSPGKLCNSIVFDNNINVGISNTSPQQKLHVSGNTSSNEFYLNIAGGTERVLTSYTTSPSGGLGSSLSMGLGLPGDLGGSNIFVGNDIAFNSPVNYNGNTLVGEYLSRNNNLMTDNVLLGQNIANKTGSATADASRCVFIGNLVAENLETSNDNVMIGYNSGHASDIVTGNTFVGASSANTLTAGEGNVSMGWNAGYSLNTGNNNVFVGHDCTGDNFNDNTAIGHHALTLYGGGSLAVGSQSFASGVNATAMGSAAHSGTESVVVGSSASGTYANDVVVGFSASASNANATAVGDNSIAGINATALGSASNASGSASVSAGTGSVSAGSHSIAMGVQSSAQFTSSIAIGDNAFVGAPAGNNPNWAIAIGYFAQANNASCIAIGNTATASNADAIGIGSNVVASGLNAVSLGNGSSVTGDNSTALGNDVDVTNYYNATGVGNNADPCANNSMMFGDINVATWGFGTCVQSGYVMEVNLPNTTATATMDNGGHWSPPCDRNLKDNITPVNYEDILNKINELEISRWKYKWIKEEDYHIAPMAQDFHRLFGIGSETRYSYLDPTGVALAGIKGLNEKLVAAIENKDAEIKQLKDQVAALESAVASCCSNYEPLKQNTEEHSDKPFLEQNNPNPFNEKTIIRYYIPSTVKNAVLNIYSLGGERLKSIQLTAIGKGEITINGMELSSGTYVYNLIADGHQVDSKWMTLTK